MGTNNFDFFFVCTEKQDEHKTKSRARVRTHLYVLCTQLTYIQTHTLDV